MAQRFCCRSHCASFDKSSTSIHMCDHVCPMTHSYARHDTIISATWPIHMCDMTHSYMTWLIDVWRDLICDRHYVCPMTHSYVRHDPLSVRHELCMCATWLIISMCAIWLIRMCDMTRSGVRYDSILGEIWLIRTDSISLYSKNACIYSCIHVWMYTCIAPAFMRVTWLIHIRDTTDWYVTWLIDTWRASLIRDVPHSYVIRLIHLWHDSLTCEMTHSYVITLIHIWHDSLTCDMTHSHVTWLIHMWHASFTCAMTHLYVTWLIHMYDMSDFLAVS